MIEPYSHDVLWLVIAGFIMAFILAFGIGANDVANSFGTSVGSKVLTVRQACCLATVFEILGSILIGYKVSDTIRKGILEVDMYIGSEKELMLGMFASLIGSSILLFAATFFKLPVSGTHSIVGATIGFSLVSHLDAGINWVTFGTIVASWFISPVMSGVISVILFLLISRIILHAEDPFKTGLIALPIIYGLTILVNAFSIIHDGSSLLYFDKIPWWGTLLISIGLGLIVSLIVQFALVPYMKMKIAKSDDQTTDIANGQPEKINEIAQVNEKQHVNDMDHNVDLGNYSSSANQETGDSEGKHNPIFTLYPEDDESRPPTEVDENEKNEVQEVEDAPEVAKLFSFLQILTATFGSFAHGGNDVSNAIGPLIALWMIYIEGSVQQKSETPLYILAYGGFGIAVGLWVWGRRVMQTIGVDLTKITPSTGFTIEIGAALTVLIASKIGLPISTTHCKVGSVVFVGWASSSRKGVDWKLFRNIITAWVLTIPLSLGASAVTMAILRAVAL